MKQKRFFLRSITVIIIIVTQMLSTMTAFADAPGVYYSGETGSWDSRASAESSIEEIYNSVTLMYYMG